MSCCSINWSTIGAALGGLAVILGAFAAHGIDGYFAEKYAGQVKTVTGVEVPTAQKYLNDFKTGAQYQMFHSIALVLVGFAGLTSQKKKLLNLAGWCFLLGIIFFSGSLYVLTLSGQTFWGAIAPIAVHCRLVFFCCRNLFLWRKFNRCDRARNSFLNGCLICRTS